MCSLGLSLFAKACVCSTCLFISMEMSTQGETGGPGQKGSKGVKGESVSMKSPDMSS